MSKIEEPRVYRVLRILGIVALLVGVAMVVVGATVCESQSGAQIGLICGGAVLAFLTLPLELSGNIPRMARTRVQTERYLQQESEADLKVLANKTADITKEAVSTTARAIKEGLGNETIYCKHCGKGIDHDSTFCKFCGKEQ